MSNHTIGNAPGIVFLDGILTHLVFSHREISCGTRRNHRLQKRLTKGSRADSVMCESSYWRNKVRQGRNKNENTGMASSKKVVHVIVPVVFKPVWWLKLFVKKTIERENFSQALYLYMLRKIPPFFLRRLRLCQGIIHVVYIVLHYTLIFN